MSKGCPLCGKECLHWKAGDPPLTDDQIVRLLQLVEMVKPPWYQRWYESAVEFLRVRFWR